MSKSAPSTMRDTLIGAICEKMRSDQGIYFLSADFGAPSLDQLKAEHGDRFVNVGIAEQNLIGVTTGLALEGFTVFAYGIASFIAMRDFEQIRTNLALLSQTRPLNVNLISVGAGVSYEVSGPTHHCPEDISLIRTLPNIEFFSPCDTVTVKRYLDRALRVKRPKYLRFDGKPLPPIYDESMETDFETGFCELRAGADICLVATGFASHIAVKLASDFAATGIRIGVIDVFSLKPLDEKGLQRRLKEYSTVITLEEGFIGKGGLDSLIRTTLGRGGEMARVESFGFSDTYVFDNATRGELDQMYGLDENAISEFIKSHLGIR